MNTILLQKILDILREGLAHVGDFFKDLFVSDPQDGQVIGYDADAGKWKNMSIAELSIDVTDTAGPDDFITFSDAAAMPLKSLIANINIEAGTDKVVITRTGKNIYDVSKAETQEIPSGSIRNSWYNKLPEGSFTISRGNGSTLYYSICRNGISVGEYSIAANNNATKSCQEGDILWLWVSSGGLLSSIENIQIELGTTPTTYEAYNGTTETITLPSSVTSGYVDVITGQGMSGDTPFTVTPVIIKSTSGVNNIFADTGDVKAVYYTKAAGDIKSLVSITEDITSEITKNTTDFSDILLKVSQNNKVVSIEIYSATTAAAVNETFLSNLPKPAMNSKVLLVNTTLGEDGTILGTLKTSGELEIATSGAKSFSGLITYVAK